MNKRVWKSLALWISGSLALLASLATIFGWFSVKPESIVNGVIGPASQLPGTPIYYGIAIGIFSTIFVAILVLRRARDRAFLRVRSESHRVALKISAVAVEKVNLEFQACLDDFKAELLANRILDTEALFRFQVAALNQFCSLTANQLRALGVPDCEVCITLHESENGHNTCEFFAGSNIQLDSREGPMDIRRTTRLRKALDPVEGGARHFICGDVRIYPNYRDDGLTPEHNYIGTIVVPLMGEPREQLITNITNLVGFLKLETKLPGVLVHDHQVRFAVAMASLIYSYLRVSRAMFSLRTGQPEIGNESFLTT